MAATNGGAHPTPSPTSAARPLPRECEHAASDPDTSASDDA